MRVEPPETWFLRFCPPGSNRGGIFALIRDRPSQAPLARHRGPHLKPRNNLQTSMVSLIRSKTRHSSPIPPWGHRGDTVGTPWFPGGRHLVYGGGHLFYGAQTRRFKFL